VPKTVMLIVNGHAPTQQHVVDHCVIDHLTDQSVGLAPHLDRDFGCSSLKTVQRQMLVAAARSPAAPAVGLAVRLRRARMQTSAPGADVA
jgi:hypothetical protein